MRPGLASATEGTARNDSRYSRSTPSSYSRSMVPMKRLRRLDFPPGWRISDLGKGLGSVFLALRLAPDLGVHLGCCIPDYTRDARLLDSADEWQNDQAHCSTGTAVVGLIAKGSVLCVLPLRSARAHCAQGVSVAIDVAVPRILAPWPGGQTALVGSAGTEQKLWPCRRKSGRLDARWARFNYGIVSRVVGTRGTPSMGNKQRRTGSIGRRAVCGG